MYLYNSPHKHRCTSLQQYNNQFIVVINTSISKKTRILSKLLLRQKSELCITDPAQILSARTIVFKGGKQSKFQNFFQFDF